MLSEQQNNILTLIAATIFADKRVYASEIEAFAEAAAELKILRSAKRPLSEAEVLTWYEANKGKIQKNLATPYFKDWFYDLLERLSDVPGKVAIIDVMQKISLADGTVHVGERALTALAKRYWRIN